MTTREDSIAAVMMHRENWHSCTEQRAPTSSNVYDGRSCVQRGRCDVQEAHRAAIEQALKDERIRTLEAVGCGMIWEDGRDCTFADVSLEEACDRCRMLAEAKGEGHPS